MEDRLVEGVFDLPQDLRLADDHGIKAGGDPEKVAEAISRRVEIKAGGERIGRKLRLILDQEILDRFKPLFGASFYDRADLHPVAGGENQTLLDRRIRFQPVERL